MNVCKICRHKDVAEIDRQLAGWLTLRNIAYLFGVTKDGLHRHRAHASQAEKAGHSLPNLVHPPNGSLYVPGNVPASVNVLLEALCVMPGYLWPREFERVCSGMSMDAVSEGVAYGELNGLWTRNQYGIKATEETIRRVWEAQRAYFSPHAYQPKQNSLPVKMAA